MVRSSAPSASKLIIATWHCANGIAYEYEPRYEHDLPSNSQRGYWLDFRLKQSGAYIEHLGVRRELDGKGYLRTAPHVDCADDLASMTWISGLVRH